MVVCLIYSFVLWFLTQYYYETGIDHYLIIGLHSYGLNWINIQLIGLFYLFGIKLKLAELTIDPYAASPEEVIRKVKQFQKIIRFIFITYFNVSTCCLLADIIPKAIVAFRTK